MVRNLSQKYTTSAQDFCERYLIENARLRFTRLRRANVSSSAWLAMTVHRTAQTHGPTYRGVSGKREPCSVRRGVRHPAARRALGGRGHGVGGRVHVDRQAHRRPWRGRGERRVDWTGARLGHAVPCGWVAFTRRTVPTPTPSLRATLPMPTPVASSARIAASVAFDAFGRPISFL